MDPILAADRLPKLAERAMRHAILSRFLAREAAGRRVTQRLLIDDALIRFERLVARVAGDGIRPALLFAERDRIVVELRRFTESRLASRLMRVHGRDVIAVGRSAAPFDAIVRGRRGAAFGVVFRRLPRDARRLEIMRAIRSAARDRGDAATGGVVVYDFGTGSIRTLRRSKAGITLTAA